MRQRGSARQGEKTLPGMPEEGMERLLQEKQKERDRSCASKQCQSETTSLGACCRKEGSSLS